MGFLVGILTGLFASLSNNQLRKLATVPALYLSGSQFAVGAIILALVVTFLGEWELPPSASFFILSVLVALEYFNFYLYTKALQYSPQSLVGPLFSLSIVFLAPLGILILGEVPSALGWCGIVLAVVGSLLLGFDANEPTIRSSLRNLIRERGSYFMLGSAFLPAVSVILTKFSYASLSPVLSGFWIYMGLTFVSLVFVLWRGGARMSKAENVPFLCLILASGFGTVFHYVGLALLPAVYFIAFKRSSILFDVFLGRMVHGETHFRTRLFGAFVMFVAILLILFSGKTF